MGAMWAAVTGAGHFAEAVWWTVAAAVIWGWWHRDWRMGASAIAALWLVAVAGVWLIGLLLVRPEAARLDFVATWVPNLLFAGSWLLTIVVGVRFWRLWHARRA